MIWSREILKTLPFTTFQRKSTIGILVAWMIFQSMLTVAQNPLKLNFYFLNNNAYFSQNTVFHDLSGTAFKASEVAFYISGLKIKHDGNQELSFGDSVFYVNIRSSSVFDLGLQDVDHVESLSFHVGIPESLNHTDISAYPEDHPLYFKFPSMHWGWTAGYTFFLIDGMADSDSDDVPDLGFELHCNGDANLQFVETVNTATIHGDGTREIFQQVNIDQWLRNVDLKSAGAQHGAVGINASIMQNIQDYPVFTAPMNAGIKEKDQFVGTVRFNGAQNKLEITWEAVSQIGKIELYSPEGKMVQAAFESNPAGSHTFSGLPAGNYILRVLSGNGELLNRLNVVQP